MQPVCLVMQGHAQHMFPIAMVFLPAIWFLSLRQISFSAALDAEGSPDILQKSLPIALQYFAGQTIAADSEKCVAFGR